MYSIIVPVYEQWNLIPVLLEALSAQSICKALYEIILVDNGSTVIEKPNYNGLNVRILKCDRLGSYAARNLGAENARGKWLIFTDSDCIPRPDWLSAIDFYINGLKDQPAILAGKVDISSSENASWYEIYDSVKGINQAQYVESGYAATANLSVKRSLFEQLGAFSERAYSGGDVDFCKKAIRSKVQLIYLPDSVVNHPARKTWYELETKARRIVGGQLSRPNVNRLRVLLGVYTPPVRAVKKFFCKSNTSINHRVIAVLVQMRLWLTEMIEVLLIFSGNPPERR
ncbi:glycosyltransferase family 2 protein [Microbulbifer echini]|uniref:Glycosyltransferase family 2 protein n=1 Tax=Microbulbifer echini TaxID=1529067 RepID=A0ABV4NRW2_9GAMM